MVSARGGRGFLPRGFLPRGMSAWGCLPRGSMPGGCLPGRCLPRGCLPRGYLPKGYLPMGYLPRGYLSGEVCLPRGCLPRECVSQHALVQTAPSPREQNEWQTPVKILPFRNYVAGGNKFGYRSVTEWSNYRCTVIKVPHQKREGGPVLLLQNYPHPLSLRGRGPYHFPTPLNTWAPRTWPPSPLLLFPLK